MKLSLIALAFLVGTVVSIPTCTQIQQMRNAINTATQSQRPLLPLLVRLGFHDCVGGCNGCINFNNPDNNGLSLAVDTLNSIYTTNNFASFGASRADFWALAASVALSIAVRGSNSQRNNGQACNPQSCPGPCPVPCMPLKWGRVDAATCTNEPALPSPTMTAAAMFSYFQQEFGFTQNQVVAIMGAHSLGGANATNSGYRGKWTGPANGGFSEVFYQQMLNSSISWRNVNVAPPGSPVKWQYNGNAVSDNSNVGFMLNTDFELFYNLTLDSSAKTTCTLSPLCGLATPSTCGAGSCPISSTFNKALAYSKNCTLFMADFVPTYTQMLSNKNPNLQTSPACCPL